MLPSKSMQLMWTSSPVNSRSITLRCSPKTILIFSAKNIHKIIVNSCSWTRMWRRQPCGSTRVMPSPPFVTYLGQRYELEVVGFSLFSFCATFFSPKFVIYKIKNLCQLFFLCSGTWLGTEKWARSRQSLSLNFFGFFCISLSLCCIFLFKLGDRKEKSLTSFWFSAL